MKVKILRQVHPGSKPYWEGFIYDGPTDISVAGMLDHLNYNDDIINDKGKATGRVGWECSCLQGVCGACAMVINGVPSLACETFLKDQGKDEITIRPLRKFPVIHDLVVDRSAIHENLKKTDIYIGEWQQGQDRDLDHQYLAAKCLKCGLCLEVCPNYADGRNFYGAVFANDCYIVSARNEKKSESIKKTYGEHFAGGCSKSLACVDVCPMKIPTLASMAKLNKKM